MLFWTYLWGHITNRLNKTNKAYCSIVDRKRLYLSWSTAFTVVIEWNENKRKIYLQRDQAETEAETENLIPSSIIFLFPLCPYPASASWPLGRSMKAWRSPNGCLFHPPMDSCLSKWPFSLLADWGDVEAGYVCWPYPEMVLAARESGPYIWACFSCIRKVINVVITAPSLLLMLQLTESFSHNALWLNVNIPTPDFVRKQHLVVLKYFSCSVCEKCVLL